VSEALLVIFKWTGSSTSEISRLNADVNLYLRLITRPAGESQGNSRTAGDWAVSTERGVRCRRIYHFLVSKHLHFGCDDETLSRLTWSAYDSTATFVDDVICFGTP